MLQNILFPTDYFCFISFQKNIIPCSYSAPMSHLTSCTPTKLNLYLTNSLTTVVSEPDLYRLLPFHFPNLIVPFTLLRSYQRISPGPKHIYTFCNKTIFYDEELLAPCPTPKLVDHPLLSVCNCLFNIFTATLHTGDHSSICSQWLHHAMVTGAHLSR